MMHNRKLISLFALFSALYGTTALSITPGTGWKDSYSVDGQCYCDTTFDHDAGTIEVDTPQGIKTVVEICEAIGPGPGSSGNPIYNDVQCGNGPANSAADETLCPGRVDLGADGCDLIGPTWNLDQYFPAPETAGEASSETDEETSTDNTEETTLTPPEPIATEGGLLFEAENGVTADSRWTLITSNDTQDTSNDPDGYHADGSNNTSYYELLPDTLVTDSDTPNNQNQWNDPGYGPILQYEIDVPNAGVYTIAVRGYATGAHDRRIHAGVDGLWNTAGANITLCTYNEWSWSNCDDEIRTVEFATAGIHQLMFSAADDGFELDQFMLTELYDEPELGNAVAVGGSLASWLLLSLGSVLMFRRRSHALTSMRMPH